MKFGLTISSLAHASLLAWGLISFAPKPFESSMADSLPIDLVSASEFTQLTAGAKTAKKIEPAPKPVVEKIAEPKELKELAAKASDKPEINTAAEKPVPMPEPKPKPPEVKPEKAEKKEEPKPDPIAEALKKSDTKKDEPKKDEPKKVETPVPPKKPPPKLDLSQIENKLALLDKREARRAAATGDTLNQTASLGSPTGRAATLSQSEIDALRAQIQACWSPPVGVADAKDLTVLMRLQLKQDGTVAVDPQTLNRSGNPLFQVAAESARRAILRCQPYRLPVAKYEVWKDVEVNFDPRDMFRG